jgi:hypothetical protein
MIRIDHPGIWLLAAKDHVAAGLSAENKPGAFQRRSHVAA